MMAVFSRLTMMLYEAWWIALLSSFIWGILSIILSPCHLATIPLIVAFISDRKEISNKKAALLSTMFSLGILVTLIIIGIITGMMGRILGDIGGFSNYIVGVFLLLFGFYMLNIVKIPFLDRRITPNIKRKGVWAAFLIGLIFGLALGPCAFAFMAQIVGLVFSLASINLLFALSLILFFALGHCGVIIFFGTFSEMVRKYLHWTENSKGIIWLKRVCGVLIIGAAIYLFLTA
ncbi:MAG: cytochrome c biogenesis CcdA family protein [bacterium]